MPLNLENFNALRARVNKKASFIGLNEFTKNLEKHFFSDITIRDTSPSDKKINLVIELNCNLTLEEMIEHFHKGNWGCFGQAKYSLINEILSMEYKNDVRIDVEEFSIFLKDTSIIVQKIYDQSIPNQLDTILNDFVKHHVKFTKGYSEIPYEIFVAVFEEDLLKTLKALPNTYENIRNYSSFWALYFESEDDAVIYDLEKSRISDETVLMLNQ